MVSFVTQPDLLSGRNGYAREGCWDHFNKISIEKGFRFSGYKPVMEVILLVLYKNTGRHFYA